MQYTLAQLSDLQNIRDVALRYCRGVDRLDEALLKSAYWPDATDNHGAFNGNAWDFAEICMVGHDKWRSTNHCIFNHSIDLDADGTNATGELYNVVYLFQKGTDVVDTWHGRYLDRYQQREDEWRILERVCVHESTTSTALANMDIDTQAFRQGHFDRPSTGRPIGP